METFGVFYMNQGITVHYDMLFNNVTSLLKLYIWSDLAQQEVV